MSDSYDEKEPFLSDAMIENYSSTMRDTRELSPAYQQLNDANLLVTEFRKEKFADIFEEGDLDPNSNLSSNFLKKWKWGVYWTPGCGLIVYRVFNKEVTVPPGHIVCCTDEDDNHIFLKPGVYNIQDPFMKQRGGPIPLFGAQNNRNIIEHGDRCCVTVPMGMVALLLDFGQPILLPPGLHACKSDTIRFERMYRLDDSPVVQIGPYTILTVDAGYCAVTMNNGKQLLLQGGQTHLLTHQKWKFERFINMKVQSEDLRSINVASADNILMNMNATMVWKIVDAEKAAIMVTETIFRSDVSLATAADDEGGSLSKLRRDILKQAVAAIARFVSGINYADYFNAVSSIMRLEVDDEEEEENGNDIKHSDTVFDDSEKQNIENPMFDYDKLLKTVEDANKITFEFGVKIISVSIISANPANATLMNSLSTSAVASAEALQAETHARGMAKAMNIEARAAAATKKIESEADAKALLVRAKADSEAEILRSDAHKDAEILRAEGAWEAAKLIESSEVAVTLETIKASAAAIKSSDKFFFGQHPAYIPKMLNSDMV